MLAVLLVLVVVVAFMGVVVLVIVVVGLVVEVLTQDLVIVELESIARLAASSLLQSSSL